jgi:hypothetical protein
MKWRVFAVAVGIAAFGLSAPIASADVVNEAVVRCESTSSWQITIGTPSYADLTHAASGPGVCKVLTADVDDDLDFALSQTDLITGTYEERFTLVGAFVTGVPAFAGAALGPNGNGQIEVAGPDTFSGTITTVARPGLRWVAQYLPDGSCGTNCYRTKHVIVGTWVE